MLVMEEAAEIGVLSRQGKSIRAIARLLSVSRHTVRRYLRVQGQPRYRHEPHAGKPDSCKQRLGAPDPARIVDGAYEDRDRNVEVTGCHCGMAFNSQVYQTLARLLPENSRQ
jgi:predicted transcriptional regulator